MIGRREDRYGPDRLQPGQGGAGWSRALRGVEQLAQAVAVARRARAVHPRGTTFHAVLHTFGGGDYGVELLDRAQDYQALARLSRGGGLPAGWPDVLGFALRVHGAGVSGAAVDLLASTAMSGAPVARHAPFPRRRLAATYTTLAGYRTRHGRRYLAVLPDPAAGDLGADLRQLASEAARGRASFLLAVASRTGHWLVFGRISLGEPVASRTDEVLAFDPVVQSAPGLHPDGALWTVRAVAYQGSRTGRDAAPPTTGAGP